MFASVLNSIFVLLEVIVLFNAIIIVHELGHFLAARWRGLHIEEFGVWFGKPLWRKKIGGVYYSLGSIPAGGFVKLPQLAPMEALEGETEIDKAQLAPISPLDKIIVAFAGPLFSMGLAFALACGVWLVGKPTSSIETSTVIGFVEENSPAEKAGLQPGDRILEVDGHPVHRYAGMSDSVMWYIIRSEGETIPFKVERNGKELTLNSGWTRPETSGWYHREGLRQVGIAGAMPTKIEAVLPGAPAEKAGLKPGDTITHVNGTPIFPPLPLIKGIADAKGEPVNLTIKRDPDEWFNLSIKPEMIPDATGKGKMSGIGIQWDYGDVVLTHPGPVQQIRESLGTIGSMAGALFSPKSDVKAQHFSGPVGIGRVYFNILSNEQGWRMALWFSVFFNVNLAVLNMLPLPVLDGGHITLAILESIRRKPLNTRFLEVLQTGCALFLIGYILYVSFYDIVDLPWKKLKPGGAAPPAAETATPAP